MDSFTPLSQIQYSTRPAAAPLTLGHHQHVILDWAGFCRGVAVIRERIGQGSEREWIIHTLDTTLFLQALLAVLQGGREALIPGNLLPGTIAAIRGEHTGIICDEPFPGALDVAGLNHPDTVLAWAGAVANDSLLQASPPIDPRTTLVHLFTSGSTGQPKKVTKRLEQIEAEVANLHARWGAALAGRTVHATVSHQHFYGMLFQAFLPLCAGLALAQDRIAYPESFLALAKGPAAAVVCSPAFFKRLAETTPAEAHFDIPPLLFSSGGVLEPAVATHTQELCTAGVNEIFGSTETGGIAWRLAPAEPEWRLFPGNEVRISCEGVIEFKSPYLFDDGYYQTSDRGRLTAAGRLILEGRVDTVVKIEEKRVALNEVENRLKDNPLIADACVLALEQGRQFLAAIVVPSAAGMQRFSGLSRLEVSQILREWLHQWFEPTVLPRKWRHVAAIPLNSQGKRDRPAIEALFAQREAAGDWALSGLAGASGAAMLPVSRKEPEILSIDIGPHRLVMELRYPSNSIWFEGHFPQFKLLPGVVQIDWLMIAAERWLGIKPNLQLIPRLKFMKPILPEEIVILELDWQLAKSQLEFKYTGKASGEPHSAGKLKLEHAP